MPGWLVLWVSTEPPVIGGHPHGHAGDLDRAGARSSGPAEQVGPAHRETHQAATFRGRFAPARRPDVIVLWAWVSECGSGQVAARRRSASSSAAYTSASVSAPPATRRPRFCAAMYRALLCSPAAAVTTWRHSPVTARSR